MIVLQSTAASLARIDSLTIDHVEYHCVSDAIYADGFLVETCRQVLDLNVVLTILQLYFDLSRDL